MTQPGPLPQLLSRLVPLLAPLCLAVPAGALDLDWPAGAERIAQDRSPVSGYRIATGPHDGTGLTTLQATGTLIDEIWTVPNEMGDPALLAATVLEQLGAQGFDIGFACADAACGGFDFRFALPIATGPAMYVDLGRFQYLTASRPGPEGPEHVALTLSRGGQLGYAHLARVIPAEVADLPTVPTDTPEPQPPAGGPGLIEDLTRDGAAVLSDVSFATGASALADARFESLERLAAFLAEDAARRIILVGHTDAQGTLDGNIVLSRDRARAVRAHLVDRLGVDPVQVEAEGIGYLAPRASNTTTAGREANRRVEVVLIAP